MTTLTQTCAEMALVQNDFQENYKLSRAFYAAQWPDGDASMAGVYRVCASALGMLADRLSRWEAANDHTTMAAV